MIADIPHAGYEAKPAGQTVLAASLATDLS